MLQVKVLLPLLDVRKRVWALDFHNRQYRGRFSTTHVPAKKCAAFRNPFASGFNNGSPTVGWKYAGA